MVHIVNKVVVSGKVVGYIVAHDLNFGSKQGFLTLKQVKDFGLIIPRHLAPIPLVKEDYLRAIISSTLSNPLRYKDLFTITSSKLVKNQETKVDYTLTCSVLVKSYAIDTVNSDLIAETIVETFQNYSILKHKIHVERSKTFSDIYTVTLLVNRIDSYFLDMGFLK